MWDVDRVLSWYVILFFSLSVVAQKWHRRRGEKQQQQKKNKVEWRVSLCICNVWVISTAWELLEGYKHWALVLVSLTVDKMRNITETELIHIVK